MIKSLTLDHRQQVLDFCYQHERESLFALGSLDRYADPFTQNLYIGYFEDDNLIGLGSYFSTYGNCIINAPSSEIIEKILDAFIEKEIEIREIVTFKKYADVMIDHLEKQYSKTPKSYCSEIFFELSRKNFVADSYPEVIQPTEKYRDQVASMQFDTPVSDLSDDQKNAIILEREFILVVDDEVASKASVHGLSKNYFQIGGVKTLEDHRRNGYAKKVVSSLCAYYFEKGVNAAVLFTGKDNTPAQNLYLSLGFVPVEDFVIVSF